MDQKNQIQTYRPVSTIHIKDVQLIQDVLQEPEKQKSSSIFAQYNKNSQVPLIIDYGSSTTKTGWGLIDEPQLVVRSLVSKSQDIGQGISTIATMNKEVDLLKLNYRSPYQRNIVQHFGLLQSLNDYIFSQLGVNDTAVNHPLLITEPPANPEYCRTNLYEQLFQCYGAPSVFTGIDSLFSVFYQEKKLENYQQSTKLIISVGNAATHIIPVLRGNICYGEMRRINVGAGNGFDLFYQSMYLKYPHLKEDLSYFQVQALYENYSVCANNYHDQQIYFQNGIDAFENTQYQNRIQYENNLFFKNHPQLIDTLIEPILIDFSKEEQVILNEQELQKQREGKLRQAARLREIMAAKRKEKEKVYLNQLSQLEQIEQQYKEDQTVAQIQMEQLFGNGRGLEELKKRILRMKVKLGLLPKEVLEEEQYNLIDIPDQNLSPEQVQQKKIQILLQKQADGRSEKKMYDQKVKDDIQQKKDSNPQLYIKLLYEQRQRIFKQIESKKKQISELGTRNSRANMKKMQTLAQLGASQIKSQQQDNFGMDDSDWNVYREISKDDMDSEEENYEMKMNEIEIQLREMDPMFDDKIQSHKRNPYGLNLNEPAIQLGMDRVRGPQIIYQPVICGIDQSGLADTLQFLLKKFEEKDQQLLLENIILTGGGVLVNSFENRLRSEVQCIAPEGTVINIKRVEDPILNCWKGMQLGFAQNSKYVIDNSITKSFFEQEGSTRAFIKTHHFSNGYIPQ